MCARRDRNSRQRPRSRGRGLAMIEDRAELEALRRAYDLLEHPGLAARISDLVGTPIERGFQLLPERWGQVVNEASRKAIESSLSVALGTMDAGYAGAASNFWHKAAATASGATGGAFGLMALSVELPLSTTIMLRSIADIARAGREALAAPDALAMPAGACAGWSLESRRCSRSRLLRRQGSAGAHYFRGGIAYRAKRVEPEIGAGCRTPGLAGRGTLFDRGFRKGCGAGGTSGRRVRRRRDQRDIHRPFPGHGARTLHRSPAGTHPRQRDGATRLGGTRRWGVGTTATARWSFEDSSEGIVRFRLISIDEIRESPLRRIKFRAWERTTLPHDYQPGQVFFHGADGNNLQGPSGYLGYRSWYLRGRPHDRRAASFGNRGAHGRANAGLRSLVRRAVGIRSRPVRSRRARAEPARTGRTNGTLDRRRAAGLG